MVQREIGIIEDHAGEAIEEAIAYSTIGIASEDGTTLGTGVAIRYKGYNLIVTARHVLESVDLDTSWLFSRSHDPLARAAEKDLPALPAKRSRIKIPSTQILISKSADDDLAVLFVDASCLTRQNVRFHELDDTRNTPEPGISIVIMGYPGEIVVSPREGPTGLAGYEILLNVEWRFVVEPVIGLSGFNPTKHFLVDFSEDTHSKGFVAHPAGMSGSGIWTYSAFEQDNVWYSTNMLLVGIQSSWYRQSRLIKGVRIGRLLHLLQAL
jgi:hypothetical protein